MSMGDFNGAQTSDGEKAVLVEHARRGCGFIWGKRRRPSWGLLPHNLTSCLWWWRSWWRRVHGGPQQTAKATSPQREVQPCSLGWSWGKRIGVHDIVVGDREQSWKPCWQRRGPISPCRMREKKNVRCKGPLYMLLNLLDFLIIIIIIIFLFKYFCKTLTVVQYYFEMKIIFMLATHQRYIYIFI